MTKKMSKTESTEKGTMSNVQVNNQILFDGEWGVNYDPDTKTMLGGYSLDGYTFKPEFVITEIEEEQVSNAIDMCSDLYKTYGAISATYKALVYEYENRY